MTGVSSIILWVVQFTLRIKCTSNIIIKLNADTLMPDGGAWGLFATIFSYLKHCFCMTCVFCVCVSVCLSVCVYVSMCMNVYVSVLKACVGVSNTLQCVLHIYVTMQSSVEVCIQVCSVHVFVVVYFKFFFGLGLGHPVIFHLNTFY